MINYINIERVSCSLCSIFKASEWDTLQYFIITRMMIFIFLLSFGFSNCTFLWYKWIYHYTSIEIRWNKKKWKTCTCVHECILCILHYTQKDRSEMRVKRWKSSGYCSYHHHCYYVVICTQNNLRLSYNLLLYPSPLCSLYDFSSSSGIIIIINVYDTKKYKKNLFFQSQYEKENL